MIEYFKYMTSSVDWCEANFYFSSLICEFNNSWSSLLYCYFALFIFYSYQKYFTSKLIYAILISSFLVGVTSFLFHSTLSIAGQLMDEGSIVLYIVSSDLAINKNIFSTIAFSFFLIMSLFYPFYCRFLLLSIGSYIIYKTINIVKNNYLLYPYFIYTLKIFISAIIMWVIDMLFCDYLLFATHFIWHILTSIALHNLTILTILLDNKYVQLNNRTLIFTIKEKKDNYIV